MALKFVTRSQWGARPPKSSPIPIYKPTPIVYVHHVAGTMTPRQIQNLHMDKRNFNDIAYNFVIDKNGDIPIGRGFGIKGGHVLDPENKVCHGICLNGNLDINKPTQAQINSLTELLWFGWHEGHWLLDVRGHRDTMQTDCPGDNLYPLLPTIEQAARTFNLPSIPTVLDEEDSMFMYSGPNTPVFFCDGGVSVGLNERSDMKTFNDQKVKHFLLDDDTYAKFRARYPGA